MSTPPPPPPRPPPNPPLKADVIEKVNPNLPNLYIYFGHGNIVCSGHDILEHVVPPNTTVIDTTVIGNAVLTNDIFTSRLFDKSALPILFNPKQARNKLQSLLTFQDNTNYTMHITEPGMKYKSTIFFPLSLHDYNATNNTVEIAISGIHHRNTCFTKLRNGVLETDVNAYNAINEIKDHTLFNLPMQKNDLLKRFTCSIRPSVDMVDKLCNAMFGDGYDSFTYDDLDKLNLALSFDVSEFINDHPGLHYLLLCRVLDESNIPDYIVKKCKKNILLHRTQSSITHNALISDLRNMVKTMILRRSRNYITNDDILIYLKNIYDKITYKDILANKADVDYIQNETFNGIQQEPPIFDVKIPNLFMHIVKYAEMKHALESMNEQYNLHPENAEKITQNIVKQKKDIAAYKNLIERDYISQIKGGRKRKRKTIRRRKINLTKRKYKWS